MTIFEKKPVQLVDYEPPCYLISDVHFTFELDLKETIVHAHIHFERNLVHPKKSPLKLDGKNLKLLEVVLDEKVLNPKEYQVTQDHLIIFDVPDAFVLKTTCIISPIKNSELYGLYQSNGFICSHNEPEGFRNITYFLDRPDVMAKFTTTLIGCKEQFPILLSNGNLIESRHMPSGKHLATWEDPFKKPCYLFALVAGKLDFIEDTFITRSKKPIRLTFFTEPGKKERALFGMECLKHAMRFDEEVFGLEYDLSCYMIVAVDFFNMGAMENKGLNIFNTTTCFADEKTATDDNFLRVETVIGHEYFHNWSGNRIGVRDWFQLTLKEGLTVFRDQEFTCFQHDRVVKRIEDVIKLRARQFPEDQGPTAHPIQPKQYIEINNFYTPTIYDKGAEVVRMMQTLLGEETFATGLKIFFESYDGTPATIECWIDAMQRASGMKLDQFSRWYHQYGTPVIDIKSEYDEKKKTVKVHLKQSAHPNHQLLPFLPYHFPIKIGLVSFDGKPVHFQIKEGRKEKDSVIFQVKNYEEIFLFEDVSQECVLSVNRNFSVPAVIKNDLSIHDLGHLALHDTDLFNRYESFQKLIQQLMQEEVVKYEANEPLSIDTRFLSLFGQILRDQTLSCALKAKLLKLPDENELALTQEIMSVEGNYEVRKFFAFEIAKFFEEDFKTIYKQLAQNVPYRFNSEDIGKRRLKNLSLYYLSNLGNRDSIQLIQDQYNLSTHMTDRFAALELIVNLNCEEKEMLLTDFYLKFEKDPLVLIKWISVQAMSKLPDTIQSLQKLIISKGFDMKMPNHVRALFMVLAENTSIFHDTKGEAYTFYFESLRQVDAFNPQLSAMMAQSLKRIHQLNHIQKKIFKKALGELLDQYQLSSNVMEILTKIKSSC